MSDQLVVDTAEPSLSTPVLKIVMLLFCEVRTEPLYINSNQAADPRGRAA